MAKNQFYDTMATLGTIISVVYIMRYLGFNDSLPWQSGFYPIYVVGFFVGLMIKAYACSNEKKNSEI